MQKVAVVYFLNINSDKINDFRKKYDPNYNIISPHITIVFPLSDIPEDELAKHTEDIAKDFKVFPIHLNDLMKSDDGYLFLLVKEGNQEIVNLHNKLYSGLLESHLVNTPFIPHVTLGYFEAKEDFDKGYKEAGEMNLDINCSFNNLSVVKGDELTPSKIIQTFNLG